MSIGYGTRLHLHILAALCTITMQDFPPLPPLAAELERFLLSPENLPIHDFRAAQRSLSSSYLLIVHWEDQSNTQNASREGEGP